MIVASVDKCETKKTSPKESVFSVRNLKTGEAIYFETKNNSYLLFAVVVCKSKRLVLKDAKANLQCYEETRRASFGRMVLIGTNELIQGELKFKVDSRENKTIETGIVSFVSKDILEKAEKLLISAIKNMAEAKHKNILNN